MEKTQFANQILTLSDKLFRLAKSILRNEDAARDAVQDLNLKLWEKRAQLKQVDNLPAFLMRSMRNQCLDVIRQKREKNELPIDLIYDGLTPYQHTEQKDMAKNVCYMIDNLPELQRTIIRMRDVEGMEMKDISFVTGISENAVCVNLSRARQKIRDQLIKELKQVEERTWTS